MLLAMMSPVCIRIDDLEDELPLISTDAMIRRVAGARKGNKPELDGEGRNEVAVLCLYKRV